jgi:cytochrome c556
MKTIRDRHGFREHCNESISRMAFDISHMVVDAGNAGMPTGSPGLIRLSKMRNRDGFFSMPGVLGRSTGHCAPRVAVVLCLLAAAGCSTNASAPSHAAKHPMRAEKLTAAMRGFDAAVRKHVPAETDLHDRWEGVFSAIADAAAELKRSAADLSGHPPEGLELPDRGRFSVLARSLAEAAQNLEDAAARGDADAVASARSDLGHACRNCHERFRPDSPGVPDAFR